MWHAQAISAGDAKAETALQWTPAFPAKWRADSARRERFVRGPGTFTTRASRAMLPPAPTDRPSPCCLEGDRALLRLAQEATVCPPGWSYPSSLVVYGMDRSRTTPLTTFCPIDILRNTLGVGPCQYILQTEGLASETNPTPDSVMTAVEKQFKRKKEKIAAQEIREMLDQMVRHVGHAQARIRQYGRLRAILVDCPAPANRTRLRRASTPSGGLPSGSNRRLRNARRSPIRWTARASWLPRSRG